MDVENRKNHTHTHTHAHTTHRQHGVCLSLLVFTQLLLECRTLGASQTGAKAEFNAKQPFKVIKGQHFGITEKQTTDCILLCNNSGLISKVLEEIARETSESCRCRQPHGRVTAPLQGTFANIRINLILPEARVIGLHFCR